MIIMNVSPFDATKWSHLNFRCVRRVPQTNRVYKLHTISFHSEQHQRHCWLHSFSSPFECHCVTIIEFLLFFSRVYVSSFVAIIIYKLFSFNSYAACYYVCAFLWIQPYEKNCQNVNDFFCLKIIFPFLMAARSCLLRCRSFFSSALWQRKKKY